MFLPGMAVGRGRRIFRLALAVFDVDQTTGGSDRLFLSFRRRAEVNTISKAAGMNLCCPKRTYKKHQYII